VQDADGVPYTTLAIATCAPTCWGVARLVAHDAQVTALASRRTVVLAGRASLEIDGFSRGNACAPFAKRAASLGEIAREYRVLGGTTVTPSVATRSPQNRVQARVATRSLGKRRVS
jgi:hypothetical protein